MIHFFDSEIAKEYGLIEAILLQHLNFWITKNEANEHNYYNGRYWTYNSIKAFKELFPYLSERKIKYALDKLINAEILITGNYNSNKTDRTLWYAITDFGKCILQNEQMHYANLSNANSDFVKCINTDNKQQIINTDKKNIYGEFQNVFLTDAEYVKINEQGLLDVLQELSSYMASSGKKYKSHYATILNWSRRKKAEQPKKTGKMKSKPSFDIEEIKRSSDMGDDLDKFLAEFKE